MLFHRLDELSPGVDTEQVICELDEAIDPAKFEQAWLAVIARHAILRTCFHLDNDGEPRQVVRPAAERHFDYSQFTFDDAAAARRQLEAYIVADRRAGFPSLTGPLLRVALFRGGPAQWWFVTTFHHLLLDGRAMTVMFREVLDIHDALVRGAPLDLPDPHPFGRYIEWLETQDLAGAEKFWRGYLRGLAGPTVLPIAAAGSSADEPVGPGELGFRLTSAAHAALRAAARLHGVTMNTLLQAAWGIVLSRYTAEKDIVFGAVRACRHIPVEGAGAIVGLLINTIPVRMRVEPGAELGPWLQALRKQWMAFRDYEHSPLMKIQQWSGIAPGRPLFETIFNYQEPSWDEALRQLGGAWERRRFEIRSEPNYPLAIDAYGGASTLVKLLFDRRRFTAEAMARLLGNFRVTLESFAAAEAGVPIGSLPLLTAGEQRQLIELGRGMALEYPREDGVHTAVKARAAETPDSIAVKDTNLALTYGELGRAAGQLARQLRGHGVGSGGIVAVCMERSVEMIAAWLGIWEAGGAFLPLDPQYPAERLAFQLEDSAAAVVITQRRLLGRLPARSAATLVFDADDCRAAAVAVAPDDASLSAACGASARDLAYVIYTSGSTGVPKGVQIEHRALMNLIAWHRQAFKVTAADRASQVASPAFDASVWEIWPYLTAGASVHLPVEEARVAPAQLWRWMAEEQITIGFLPTPVLEAAMNEPWPQRMALRALLTGGDRLKRRPPENFPCELINNYGPTEYTVVATSGPVSAESANPGAPSIGRPVANTHAYIVDREMRLVPMGVPGELALGGESLARGYLNRPELDAEKFVPDPFYRSSLVSRTEATAARQGPARLYRTGDLVRWTEQGDIEYLGRMDGQVKIRGCRIELGEIEAVLGGHPAVRETLVLPRPDGRGELQLIAYVLPHRTGVEDCALLEYLRAKLPAYMVPVAVMLMDAWPLTPNGKIDRHALPAPSPGTPGRTGSSGPLANHTEQTIARVYGEILGRGPIGRDDNFFDLGGHSLLAAQAVSRLNHALQCALSVRTIFDLPTIAGLARELENRGTETVTPRTLKRLKRRSASPAIEILQPN